jgi:phage terminase Nu1 subunit (DNA packaging protein)
MEITAKTEVSTKEIALILGVTARWVQQLTQDGILRAVKWNRYNLAETVQAYAEFRTAHEESSDGERERLEAELSIKKANAVMKNLEAKELLSKMHRAEHVAGMTEDLICTIESMLRKLPERLADDVTAVGDPAEVADLIRKEVHAIMADLSDYRYVPKKHEGRLESS